jgi:hypothetical protein
MTVLQHDQMPHYSERWAFVTRLSAASLKTVELTAQQTFTRTA